MHIFDGEVGRDQQLVSRRNAQHRAVIANAGYQPTALRGQRRRICWISFFSLSGMPDHYTPVPVTCQVASALDHHDERVTSSDTPYGGNLAGWAAPITLPW